jgi:hypothetical protein
MEYIEHFAFVLNDVKTWAHWGTIYLEMGGMFLVTHVAFAHIFQFMKVKCKYKFKLLPLNYVTCLYCIFCC